MNRVDYPAYKFVDSERAAPVKNSWGYVISTGIEKSRLHLMAYKGDEGDDRYAIAAKKLSKPELDLIDRHFCVLYQHTEGTTTTWYKINKNSLKKRLGLDDNDMKQLVKDGKDGSFIEQDLEALAKKHAGVEQASKTSAQKPDGPDHEPYPEGVTHEKLKENFDSVMPHAANGDPNSQWYIGYYYENGWGVKRDYTKAFKWYTKAAEEGRADKKQPEPNAQCGLGRLYELGLGVKKDDGKAFEWYSKAAEQSNTEAEYMMGRFYHHGRFVEKDDVKAYEYYQKATISKNDDTYAQLAQEALAKRQQKNKSNS